MTTIAPGLERAQDNAGEVGDVFMLSHTHRFFVKSPGYDRCVVLEDLGIDALDLVELSASWGRASWDSSEVQFSAHVGDESCAMHSSYYVETSAVNTGNQLGLFGTVSVADTHTPHAPGVVVGNLYGGLQFNAVSRRWGGEDIHFSFLPSWRGQPTGDRFETTVALDFPEDFLPTADERTERFDLSLRAQFDMHHEDSYRGDERGSVNVTVYADRDAEWEDPLDFGLRIAADLPAPTLGWTTTPGPSWTTPGWQTTIPWPTTVMPTTAAWPAATTVARTQTEDEPMALVV